MSDCPVTRDITVSFCMWAHGFHKPCSNCICKPTESHQKCQKLSICPCILIRRNPISKLLNVQMEISNNNQLKCYHRKSPPSDSKSTDHYSTPRPFGFIPNNPLGKYKFGPQMFRAFSSISISIDKPYQRVYKNQGPCTRERKYRPFQPMELSVFHGLQKIWTRIGISIN